MWDTADPTRERLWDTADQKQVTRGNGLDAIWAQVQIVEWGPSPIHTVVESRSGRPDVGIREAYPGSGSTRRGVPGFDRPAARRVALTSSRRISGGEIFACHAGKPPIETTLSVEATPPIGAGVGGEEAER